MMRADGPGPKIGVVFDRQRGLIVADQADRPVSVLGFADHLNVAALRHDVLQAFADDGMVVGDEESNHETALKK